VILHKLPGAGKESGPFYLRRLIKGHAGFGRWSRCSYSLDWNLSSKGHDEKMVDLANGDPSRFLLYWAVCMACGMSESVYCGLEHCSGDPPVVMLT
jgi:hypothetical protein